MADTATGGAEAGAAAVEEPGMMELMMDNVLIVLGEKGHNTWRRNSKLELARQHNVLFQKKGREF